MSKKHEFKEEDEDDNLRICEENEQLESENEEEALDLSVKSRNVQMKSSNENANKRKNKPIKLEEESLVIENITEPETNEEDAEEMLEFDDYLSNPQEEDLNESIIDVAQRQTDQPQSTEISINDSSADLANESEETEESLLKKQFLKNKKSKAKTVVSISNQVTTTNVTAASKKQMRFQCRFCVYKSHSVSLMQNHIYRHIDTTPYSCFYCGHKSTTKSTIMVHIELCHPNMEVKIKESRVKEEDYYLDLNAANNSSQDRLDIGQTNKQTVKTGGSIKRKKQDSDEQVVLSFKSFNSSLSPSLSSSSESSLCSSPSQSPNPHKAVNADQLQIIKTANDEDLLLNNNPESLDEFSKDPNSSNSYVTVFNRPKQYFGSLYEPDKQYSCKLCTYTTNHKPSMEDHVYVHTNKRPYRCGYCNEEIYTRYAATYHNKYKHPGEPRNFIKDEQDVSIYYVNRAKKNSSSGTSASSFAPSLQTNSTNSPNDDDLNTNPSSKPNQNKTVESNTDTVKLNSNKKFKKTHETSSIRSTPENTCSKSTNSTSNLTTNQFTSNPLAQLILSSNNTSPTSNNSTPQSPPSSAQGYDFNLALKMYQIQLQSIMAANYLQSAMRSNPSPSANFLASCFGLNQEQMQQLSSFLAAKNKLDSDSDANSSANQNEQDLNDSSLNSSDNSDLARNVGAKIFVKNK